VLTRARPSLLRGRWLAGHVVALVVFVTFVSLGFWQLDRNQQKHDKDDAARAAFAAPAPDVVDVGDDVQAGTRASATGTYDPAGDVLLRNRVRDGRGGYDVLTPLRLADGTGVLVDRGWVSREAVNRGARSFTPPGGEVTVRGPVAGSRPLQPDDQVETIHEWLVLPRVDIARVAREVGADLRPVWITAQVQEPAPGPGAPALPEPEPSDRVNHMQYALQWFAFAAIAAVGWPIVLWRVATRSGPRGASTHRVGAGTR
jgi:surfeit locus 1 family protein